MQPIDRLVHILNQVPWNITQSTEENLESLPEILEDPVKYQHLSRFLTTPILGLRRIKLYYPISEDYFHPVEYASQTDISPLEVLRSITAFYDLPFTQANADAISRLTGQPTYQVEPDERIFDSQGGHVFFEGLIPHDDGYTLSLGS